jgi:chromate reductase
MRDDSFNVLGLAGSLGRRSYNRALLAAAVELAPEGVEVTTLDLAALPMYNPDFDENLAGGGPSPAPVEELVERVRAADALLLASPEYNWGPSGVIKNALDWVSRPVGASPLFEKPVALAGVSPGPAGTGRAQLQLRDHLLSTNSYVLQQPVVQIGDAKRRFDSELRLIDAETRELVVAQLVALRDWARRLAPDAVPG